MRNKRCTLSTHSPALVICLLLSCDVISSLSDKNTLALFAMYDTSHYLALNHLIIWDDKMHSRYYIHGNNCTFNIRNTVKSMKKVQCLIYVTISNIIKQGLKLQKVSSIVVSRFILKWFLVTLQNTGLSPAGAHAWHKAGRTGINGSSGRHWSLRHWECFPRYMFHWVHPVF